MMSKEKRRVPKLRFPGFTEDWEQRKLSDILKVNSGKDYKHLDQGTIPVYGTGGYMLSVNESLSNIDAIGIGRKGTIDKPQYLKAPFWTVDTLFYLTALDKHSILFLYYLMQLIPWKKFDESTGVPSLSKTTIDNINGYVPLNPKEEELISALFSQLDKSITLHQRKLNNLKLKKKALLQKLFPKNGERYPEIRFSGFTDAWEQRKLGKCVDISTGYPFDSQDFNENGEYLVITNGNIQGNTPFVLNNVGNRIDLDDSLKKYILDIDDLLITMDGTVGRVAIVVNNKLVLAQRVCRIKSNEPYYIYQLLSKNNFIQSMNKIGHGGTIKHISLSEISEYQDFYPKSQKERIKISTVLTNCDKLITLHQRKLDHLQLQKKALLQQMFV